MGRTLIGTSDGVSSARTAALAVVVLLGLWLAAAGGPAVSIAGAQTNSPGEGVTQLLPGTEEGKPQHSDPFSFVLLELAIVVGAAMVGRYFANRVRQPSVLGEMLVGVVVGNVGYWHGSEFCTFVMNLGAASPVFTQMAASGQSALASTQEVFSAAELLPGEVGGRTIELIRGPLGARFITIGFSLWLFANLGVVLLLFKAGLESSMKDMLRVGPRAAGVAVLGTVAPFSLGLAATLALMPDAPLAAHLFAGATLCATSVGVTARVLKDLRREDSDEARVILGAAVMDDVLGLIVLAVVVGVAVSGRVEYGKAIQLALSAGLFLGAVILFGEKLVKRLVPLMAVLDRSNVRLLFPLLLAFVLAWLANMVQLAPIVGAFAAGLVLNESQFAAYEENLSVQEWIRPLESVFSPIFFVLMGMQVNLEAFMRPKALMLGAALLLAATVGKLAAGIAAGRSADRLSVGLGMVPRGEVGLIFASVGRGLGVVGDIAFSAIVMMVIVTTLITPPALRWSLYRRSGPASA